MNKELTPLEALEEIKSFILDIQCGTFNSKAIRFTDSFVYLEQNVFPIIETALKKQIIDDNEHPRKKGFKQDNRLRLAYQEMGRYLKNKEVPQELRGKPYGDIIGIIPEDEERRWDLYLLFNMLLNRPIKDDEFDRDKKEWVKYPCLLQELENRGYDVKTIYFEIAKRNKKRKYIPYKNYLRYNENFNFDSKTDQKKLKALEIIKKKEVDIHFLLTCLNTPIIDLKLQTISIEKQLEMYNSSVINHSTFVPDTSRCLNKEEFELLKEVLL